VISGVSKSFCISYMSNCMHAYIYVHITYLCVCISVHINMYGQVVLEVDEQVVGQLSFKIVLHITHV